MLRNPENGKVIAEAMDTGESIPDHIVNALIEKRLNETDCKLSGWVLEGFPTTKPQINLLKAMRIKPLLVFMFEQNEEECVRRLGNRGLDPETGLFYNVEVNPATDEAAGRLVSQDADSEPVVRKKFRAWRDDLPFVEEAFRKEAITMGADRSIEDIAEMMCEELENCMRA